VRALEQLAAERDYDARLLRAVEQVNRGQLDRTVDKIERELGGARGRTVAVLGLAFKPNTDDVRDAPALAIIRRLLERGGTVRAHDPIANAIARSVLDDSRVAFFDDMYETVEGADAIVLATEWNEFRALDFERCAAAMRGTLLIDGRNVFDADQARAAGLNYVGVGRVTLSSAK
jgi:UDPglucose 6-dehydrogenase